MQQNLKMYIQINQNGENENKGIKGNISITNVQPIVVDKITQIVGNDIILTECRTSPLQQWQGNNKDKVQIGDIVLLDITDCYNRIIIHKFSQAEKHVIINLPTEEYRKVNPLHPMEQATDLNSLGMIKGLYKSITSH